MALQEQSQMIFHMQNILKCYGKFEPAPQRSLKTVLARLHFLSDTVGPIKPRSKMGNRHIITFLDLSRQYDVDILVQTIEEVKNYNDIPRSQTYNSP